MKLAFRPSFDLLLIVLTLLSYCAGAQTLPGTPSKEPKKVELTIDGPDVFHLDRVLEDGYQQFADFFGYQPQQPIKIRLFADKESWEQFSMKNGLLTRGQEGFAVCDLAKTDSAYSYMHASAGRTRFHAMSAMLLAFRQLTAEKRTGEIEGPLAHLLTGPL